MMDKARFPELEVNYGQKVSKVYTHFSAFFIRYHGSGFFLSLIKSEPRLRGIPSWAADWTTPWPNYKSIQGRDFAAGSRSIKVNDAGVEFNQEDGHQILRLYRLMILRGFFTRDGHMDDSTGTHVEDVKHLSEDEVLIEMYPGLAALLRKQGEYYVFTRVCLYALSEIGVEKLTEMWSRVVVDGDGLEEQTGQSAEACGYLSSPETFKI